jgi:hypothetical protein
VSNLPVHNLRPPSLYCNTGFCEIKSNLKNGWLFHLKWNHILNVRQYKITISFKNFTKQIFSSREHRSMNVRPRFSERFLWEGKPPYLGTEKQGCQGNWSEPLTSYRDICFSPLIPLTWASNSSLIESWILLLSCHRMVRYGQGNCKSVFLHSLHYREINHCPLVS